MASPRSFSTILGWAVSMVVWQEVPAPTLRMRTPSVQAGCRGFSQRPRSAPAIAFAAGGMQGFWGGMKTN